MKQVELQTPISQLFNALKSHFFSVNFFQIGCSEQPNKTLNFRKIILWRHHFRTLLNFVYSNKGAGQSCCYNEHGNLMVGAPDGGSLNRVHPKVGLPVLSHYFHDRVPYHDCCQQSHNCDKYYEKRPSDDSSNYEPPQLGNQKLVGSLSKWGRRR